MNQSTLILLIVSAAFVQFTYGQDFDESVPELQKRKSAYMRFGRSAPDFEDGPMSMAKRKSAYMRFGKRSSAPLNSEVAEFYEADEDPSMEKRKSAYMRFGKRKSAYMRFGKRSAAPEVEFIPIDLDPVYYMEKRKPASIRFG